MMISVLDKPITTADAIGRIEGIMRVLGVDLRGHGQFTIRFPDQRTAQTFILDLDTDRGAFKTVLAA